MQTPIYTDSSGLRVLWDEKKKCYCFEEKDGQLLQFTLVMHSGDPEKDGYSGPTIEALLAIAKHRINTYNQGAWRCVENERAMFGAELGLWNLEKRAARRRLELITERNKQG